jgi:Asp-tRNA(Asn)/Glu-tRNA(Gln) amidotransferase A subunit family amidase
MGLEDVMARYVEAIDARETTIKAFVHFDRDRFTRVSARQGPLAGLPVGIKDIIDTVDMPTECGSPIYRGRVPVNDAPVVSQIWRAGGHIAGKTVTTEFAAVSPGATTNPHNPKHTPGGSSSGSAAAIAAGFLPFSVGTQTGGSVVRPAAFCGIAGLKPTIGLFPAFGVKGFSWTLDTVGIFAKTVPDLGFFAEAITGQPLAVSDDDWAPRIGVARMNVWDEVSPAMAQAVDDTCGHASTAGAKVTQLPVEPIFEAVYRAHFVVQDYELARSLAWEVDNHSALLSEKLRTMIAGGAAIPTENYIAALADARRGRAVSDTLFGDADVLIAPSASMSAPAGLESTGSPNCTRLWTLLGLPTVNVAGIVDGNGLPLGIQIIGRAGDDRKTLQAAAWIEAAIANTA